MGKERPVDTAFQRLIVSRLKVPCLFPLITVGLSTLTVGGFAPCWISQWINSGYRRVRVVGLEVSGRGVSDGWAPPLICDSLAPSAGRIGSPGYHCSFFFLLRDSWIGSCGAKTYFGWREILQLRYSIGVWIGGTWNCLPAPIYRSLLPLSYQRMRERVPFPGNLLQFQLPTSHTWLEGPPVRLLPYPILWCLLPDERVLRAWHLLISGLNLGSGLLPGCSAFSRTTRQKPRV